MLTERKYVELNSKVSICHIAAAFEKELMTFECKTLVFILRESVPRYIIL